MNYPPTPDWYTHAGPYRWPNPDRDTIIRLHHSALGIELGPRAITSLHSQRTPWNVRGLIVATAVGQAMKQGQTNGT